MMRRNRDGRVGFLAASVRETVYGVGEPDFWAAVMEVREVLLDIEQGVCYRIEDAATISQLYW
jgi:hypothetical protein